MNRKTISRIGAGFALLTLVSVSTTLQEQNTDPLYQTGASSVILNDD